MKKNFTTITLLALTMLCTASPIAAMHSTQPYDQWDPLTDPGYLAELEKVSAEERANKNAKKEKHATQTAASIAPSLMQPATEAPAQSLDQEGTPATTVAKRKETDEEYKKRIDGLRSPKLKAWLARPPSRDERTDDERLAACLHIMTGKSVPGDRNKRILQDTTSHPYLPNKQIIYVGLPKDARTLIAEYANEQLACIPNHPPLLGWHNHVQIILPNGNTAEKTNTSHSKNDEITFRYIETGDITSTFKIPERFVGGTESMASFSEDELAAVAYEDTGTIIKIVNSATGVCTGEIPTPNWGIRYLATTPKGRLMAATWDQEIVQFDHSAHAWKTVYTFKDQSAPRVNAITFINEDTFIAALNNNFLNKVVITNIKKDISREILSLGPIYNKPVVLPCGNIAVNTLDGNVYIINPNTGHYRPLHPNQNQLSTMRNIDKFMALPNNKFLAYHHSGISHLEIPANIQIWGYCPDYVRQLTELTELTEQQPPKPVKYAQSKRIALGVATAAATYGIYRWFKKR